MRDHYGSFVHGFYGSVGVSDIMHAELMAIFHGVSLCWRLGFKKVTCCSDSLHIIQLIKDGGPNYHRNVIAAIRKLVSREWDFQIVHTLREGNYCADFLAKFGARSNASLVTMDAPLEGMGTLLMADAMGVTFLRQ